MRRALVSSLAVVLVVAADAAWRMPGLPGLVFVGYSVLIWAVPPALATLGIAGFTALSGVELPRG
ncbi:hypothetical protein [Antribacter gilvus]|uniref:hypothetical protein n=1 Tax=Antribacter gilvus TaxID=2304675 RepID=UPI000F77C36D|nr:hypothetical protein [Antribacter gilvus]